MDPTSQTPGFNSQFSEQGHGTPDDGDAGPTLLNEEVVSPRDHGASPQLQQAAFRDRFEALLPTIQRQWPEVARHTLEATRGSFDTVVEVISRQTGLTSGGVRQQLQELLRSTGEQAHQMADHLRPLEDQLEQLLDDLNTTLRPRIEKPVREKPLMALGIAAGVGLVLGMLLSGRRSA
jgi:ElaB/YqjD/DUF883 family membrane-anchored ribosome-binding protein